MLCERRRPARRWAQRSTWLRELKHAGSRIRARELPLRLVQSGTLLAVDRNGARRSPPIVDLRRIRNRGGAAHQASMPRREDLKSILIIGSGPIVIGQACEFDYSGTQACKRCARRVIASSSSTRIRRRS